MASDEFYCFFKNKYARKIGEISLERYLRNGLSHVFRGVRHSEDERLNIAEVRQWAWDDIVLAAIKLCMLQGDLDARPGAEDTLVEMLLKCESESLDDLRTIEQSQGTTILDTPVFYQLIIAMALSRGNRELVKDMIRQAPPAPGHELLFGTEKEDPITNTTLIKFGSRSALSHGLFQGQIDNGCEIWSAMIRSGWAAPRRYMLAWAASSPAVDTGIELLKTLAEHNIKVEEGAVSAAIRYGQIPMLDYILSQYIPDIGDPLTCSINHAEAYDFLTSAAKKRQGGVDKLELLWKYNVNELNWTPDRDPNDRLEARTLVEAELNVNLPQQTPLHAAATLGNAEVVEWLIKKGAMPHRDYVGNTPYDAAKEWKQKDVMAIFEKYGWKLSERSSRNT